MRSTSVPDFRKASEGLRSRALAAFDQLLRREFPTGEWLSEQCAWKERQSLDDAVLELIGFIDENERSAVRSELYQAVHSIYRARREVELKAQRNRGGGGRRPTARSLAEEIWLRLPTEEYRSFPEDFIDSSLPTESIALDGELVVGTHLMTHGDLIARGSVKIGAKIFNLRSDARAEFLERAARAHEGRKVPLPLDPAYCKRIIGEHTRYEEAQRADLQERAAAVTADKDLQEAIVSTLIERILHIRK
jgi:hypothetical protein